ncbi:Mg/Co/Ni transporter MgtE, CBS domain-containing [hydrothermal vent metagenome]|uniref:Mg/Co/Ni transporter MgtE, CBS domain-containing n=1 Tax=hydrothermal vent metagenome TaxID=652676 RepID=A0A3B1D3J2_9ZZZZ
MQLFLYLSKILGCDVVDVDNQPMGKLCDISMMLNEEVFPRAGYLIIKNGFWNKTFAAVSMGDVQELDGTIRLRISGDKLNFQENPVRNEFSLCRDILDQQVVDTNDQKVVRVNDVHLLRVDNQIYLAHVDVGLRGLVRRLEWTGLVDSLVKHFAPKSPYLTQEELISWKNTHVLTTGRSKGVLRSDVVRKKLAKIPSAKLADIMEDLDVFEKVSLFKTFSEDMQRRVFTDMTPHEKEELVDQLEDREVGNLLENIPADEATDLLHNLPKEKTIQLMRFMHSKTSKELRKLLGFAQDSAGGLMTTEYLYLGEDALVKDAMDLIKKNVNYPGNVFYVYIVDDKNRLVGTTSLRRFINEAPETLLTETCYHNKVCVRTDDGMEEVALLLEKYKYSSIPVLNEGDVLQGVITSDDVMEELISLTWRKYKDQL